MVMKTRLFKLIALARISDAEPRAANIVWDLHQRLNEALKMKGIRLSKFLVYIHLKYTDVLSQLHTDVKRGISLERWVIKKSGHSTFPAKTGKEYPVKGILQSIYVFKDVEIVYSNWSNSELAVCFFTRFGFIKLASASC
jgi:hypothetical protein